ncbi:Rrf2 family transcriptional regulator [Pseudolactococcus yaeyamensis]
MKIKSGVEQSIYILLILGRIPTDTSITSEDISTRLKLSQSYLKKLLKSLGHEGLVTSSTGKKGGFSLAKPISEINLSHIFYAVEGRGSLFNETKLGSYFIGEGATENKECSLSVVMDTIEDSWRKILENITLKDLETKILLEFDTTQIDAWIQRVTSDSKK